MEVLPNEIVLKIFQYMPMKERVKMELVSKRFMEIHRSAPPNIFVIENDVYLAVSCVPGLRYGGVPVPFFIKKVQCLKRPVFPWEAAKVVRFVIFQFRPNIECTRVFEELLRRIAPACLRIDGRPTDLVLDTLFHYLSNPKIIVFSAVNTPIYDVTRLMDTYRSITSLTLGDGFFNEEWVGRIPNSVKELCLCDDDVVTNLDIANLAMVHVNIANLEIRDCPRIDTGIVVYLNELVNAEGSQRGLYLKVINDETVFFQLENLDFELHVHQNEILECCAVRFYQNLVVVHCSRLDNDDDISSDESDSNEAEFGVIELEGSDDESMEDNEVDIVAMENDENGE